jgi:hypothetical protein
MLWTTWPWNRTLSSAWRPCSRMPLTYRPTPCNNYSRYKTFCSTPCSKIHKLVPLNWQPQQRRGRFSRKTSRPDTRPSLPSFPNPWPRVHEHIIQSRNITHAFMRYSPHTESYFFHFFPFSPSAERAATLLLHTIVPYYFWADSQTTTFTTTTTHNTLGHFELVVSYTILRALNTVLSSTILVRPLRP